MAVARYWKLTEEGSSTVTWARGFGNIIFAATPGGVQQATSGMVTSSGSAGSNVIANLVDGSNTTYFLTQTLAVTAPFNQWWIKVDFGGSTTVAEFRVTSINQSNWASHMPSHIRVYSSDDDITWVYRGVLDLSTVVAQAAAPVAVRWVDPPIGICIGGDAHPVAGFAQVPANYKAIPALTRCVCRSVVGSKRIAGVTTSLSNPVSRMVYLIAMPEMTVVDYQLTRFPACAYAFENVRSGLYTVLGVDVTQEQNCVAFSHVVAV